MKSIYLSLATLATFLLTGCGGGGGGNSSSSSSLITSTYSGQIIDSYIKNVSYTCGTISSITDENGGFLCNELPVTFKIANVSLGEISQIPSDKHIFPQDLLGLDRTNFVDSNLIKMAQFLQTLDSDSDATNGITIDDATINLLTDESYLNFDANDIAKTLVSEADAIAHLQDSIDFVNNISSISLPQAISNIVLTPSSTLNEELIHTITYMADEERLAYDIYNKFYELYGQKQFKNISDNGEITHIQAVQSLVKKYELTQSELYANEIATLQEGVYSTSEVQNLYNGLYDKGVKTLQDALEVGCMVEVTDVNDLNNYIQVAQNSDANDIVDIFDLLRAGSYNHYWSFDKALKNLGVSTGCCSLGDDYCKTTAQYPSTNGN